MASEAENRLAELQRAAQASRGRGKVVTDPTPRPFEDPRERRAFCLKSAIEASGHSLVAMPAEEILDVARAFETYINRADSEVAE